MSASVVSGRLSGVAVLSLLVLLLLAPSPAPAKPFDLSQIVSVLADHIFKRLFTVREIELLGHYCTLRTQPYFSRWRLHHKASVTCPGWTTALGRAEGFLSPVTSEREATRDIVRKLVENGLVTRKEASHWL
ncbi:hypothetical protein OTU49_001422 [Cherax quadricarinatus]|uniref:Anti-lipopolysaccharide factor n=1 Tax=Cherax quadricarinatus TaxID=27406 RepID=A0AAW0XG03_CHEQU|nr:anti-lipopolysaccharide factor-like [Cherax quadricarinatus]